MIEGPLSLAAWNGSRYDPASASGHYESWFQRANHPRRPLAFWIRYTIFSPKGRPADAFGEVWAVYFDGERGRNVAVKESVPLARCRFARKDLEARIGLATLNTFHLEGRCRSRGHTMRWQLDYAGDEPAVFLLPQRLYDRTFQRAKALVGTPDALYRGVLTVDGKPVRVDGWPGTQNHNWGSRHTDAYAWGQVAGFDGAPDAFLECATAKERVGGLPLPSMTMLVLRADDEEYRLNGVWQAFRASGSYEFFDWRLDSSARGVRVRAHLHAPAASFVALRYDDPPGGAKACLNTKLAACEVTLEVAGRAPKTFTSSHRAAFEILTSRTDHGVAFVA
ncbi:MAG: hypothetical protein ABI330_05070 [Caldimonas sp.]